MAETDARRGHETIYIVLPVHNRRSMTEGFVRCVLAQSDPDYQLVLVDDGSTDGTEEAVRRLMPGVTVIRGTGDWWWAGCLQQAGRWLKTHASLDEAIVLFANDDTKIDPGFLAAGRAALNAEPRSLVLAQLHDGETGGLVEVGVHIDWAKLTFEGVLEPQRVDCFSTRGLFMHLRDLLELGLFHPRLLPHYGSDYEFTIRAHRRGFALRTDPRVRLTYDESATGIRSPDSGSLRAFLLSTFSRRSTLNPVYQTAFVLLACPIRYMPRNIARTWMIFAIALAARVRPRP